MVNKDDEMILAVDRGYLFDDEHLAFQGVTTNPRHVREINRRFNNYIEVRRGDAEKNKAWKQPITYAILRRGEEVFLYKRLKKGGETRLHDQLSIGVGGHMNRINDVRDWKSNLMINMYRELNEELDIDMSGDWEPEPRVVGLINDDENEVGKVHIGILAIIDLPEGCEVNVLETDKLEGSWIRIRDLVKTPLYESLEPWSQIATEVL